MSVSDQEAVDKVLGLDRDRESVQVVLGPPQGGVFNVLEHDVSVLVVERRHAREHLVGQNAQRPPVRSFAVPNA